MSNLEGLAGTSPDADTEDSSWTLADWVGLQDSEPSQTESSDLGEGAIGRSAHLPSDSPHDLSSLSSETPAEALLFTNDFTGFTPDESSPPGHDHPSSIEPPPPASDGTPLNLADELLESTIIDWFASVNAEPAVTPESTQDTTAPQQAEAETELDLMFDRFDASTWASEPPPAQSEQDSLFDWQAQATSEDDDNAEAFTLEGLGNLFEGVPPVAPPSRQPRSDTDTQSVTIDSMFGDDAFGENTSSPVANPEAASHPPQNPTPSQAQGTEKKKFSLGEPPN